MPLEFEEETHTYRLDGKIIPSVTEILTDVGLYPDFSMTDPWYAERGSLVHLATHYYDNGTLDPDSIDDEIHGYLKSYLEFKNVYLFDVKESEMRVHDPIYWYAGTADKLGDIDWDGQRREALPDLKCGPPEYGYQFQIAGYSMARGLHHSTLRLGVYLNKNGKLPKVIEYNDPGDFEIFKAATLLFHAKRKRGNR